MNALAPSHLFMPPALFLALGTLATLHPVSAEDMRVLVVETLEAKPKPSYQRSRAFMGRVEAARSSELGFELAGTVTKLTVDEGEHISAGQVIAELDTARLKAQRTQLEAALKDAQAQERLAKITLGRNEQLVASRATSEQSLDEARNAADSATAQVNLAQAQIDQVDVDLGKSSLRAPFDGVIAKRFVDEGTITTAGAPVFHILETSALEIRVGVNSRALQSIDQGDAFELATTDGTVQAQVDRILSQRDERTRTVDVILKVDSAQAKLRHGDLIEVPLDLKTETAGYWLPRTALTESERGLWACYVAVPSKEKPDLLRLERRQLELLHATEERVFARGAIQPGDQVVISGLQRLMPDQHVRIRPAELTAR